MSVSSSRAYSQSYPCDHSRKQPALFTATFMKPPFEWWLKLCDEKLPKAITTTFGITQLYFSFVFKLL